VLREWRQQESEGHQPLAVERFAFPHEPSRIGKCHHDGSTRLHAYRILVPHQSPDDSAEGCKPTVLVDRDEGEGVRYMFDGFTLLTHQTIAHIPPPVLIQANRNSEYHVCLAPDQDFGAVQQDLLRDGGVDDLDWFHAFFFGTVLQLDDFLNPTLDKGCRRFHLFPRFVHRGESTHLMSPGRVRRCLTQSRVSALELIRNLKKSDR
jgi:hypothetical protein